MMPCLDSWCEQVVLVLNDITFELPYQTNHVVFIQLIYREIHYFLFRVTESSASDLAFNKEIKRSIKSYQ